MPYKFTEKNPCSRCHHNPCRCYQHGNHYQHCGHCHKNPCECGNHPHYNTPVGQPFAVLPPGSQILKLPGCNKNQQQTGEPPIPIEKKTNCDNINYFFTVKENFDFGTVGSFEAECAEKWAKTGMYLYFPATGYIKVTGVSGDTITYKNLDVPLPYSGKAGNAIVPIQPMSLAVLSDMICAGCLNDISDELSSDDKILVCSTSGLKLVKPNI